jgi:cell division protein FtsZ
MPEVRPAIETFAKIKVIGAGGSGGSAINRMIKSKIKGVEFIAANTDVQALHYSQAATKIHLGKSITRGLGAGMNPEVGKSAAEESQNELRDALKGSDMVFITCGLGGGTGSGATPVIAEIARDAGALTVAVVTKPFSFEGAQRRDIAEKAYAELAAHVDTIISIPNDRVLQVIDKKTSLLDAFETVDDVLRQGVQGISEVITVPGLINVDFADVRAIMSDTGSALMGIGRGTGENRATEAAKAAISSPLLEVSIEGAKGILFTITGGPSLSMHEVSEAAKIITQSADQNAKVIFGTVIDESLKDELKICVIATGFDGEQRPSAASDRRVADAGFYTPNRFVRKETVAAAAAPAPTASVRPYDRRTEVQPTPVKEVQERTPEPKAAPQAVVEEVVEDLAPFVKRVLPVKEPQLAEAAASSASAEEDLEIPAFIRRKMM